MILITQSVDKKSCPFELLSSTTMMIIVYAHFNFKVQLNETLVANNNLGAVPQPLEGLRLIFLLHGDSFFIKLHYFGLQAIIYYQYHKW